MIPPLTVERPARFHSALTQYKRLAADALTALWGRTAFEVVAEVASRAIRALRSKAQPEAAATRGSAQ
jgi:hypothetical protein